MGKFSYWVILSIFAWGAVAQSTEFQWGDAELEKAKRQAKKVKILRDKWGVPHIFGDRDADTAFGLAYAHAEDDFQTIQQIFLATQDKVHLINPTMETYFIHFYANFLGIWDEVKRSYMTDLSPKVRSILEAYARGINYYIYLHRREVHPKLAAIKGEDLALNALYQMSLFIGLHRNVISLLSSTNGKPSEPKFQLPGIPNHIQLGSNAHALASFRSVGRKTTRLNINSHQPWEGPLAWYEAHLVSNEGWNMSGGTFPASPFLFVGHNDHLGWAHTVNRADFVDVYKLVMHPEAKGRYRFNQQWLTLRETEVKDIPPIVLLPRKVYRSVHGPVLKVGDDYLAVRYSGIGRHMRALEQWYRMNKAKKFSQWNEAMKLQGIPALNTVYADAKNIFYVYNGLLPYRASGYDWEGMVPGDTSQTLWNSYLPYRSLPRVYNPPSGFIQSCNSSPFFATLGYGNPNPESYPKSLGIEEHLNNRSLRSRELFGSSQLLTREEFLKYKFDQTYSENSTLYRKYLAPFFRGYQPVGRNEQEAFTLLKGWNRQMSLSSEGAGVARLFIDELASDAAKQVLPKEGKVKGAFKKAVKLLNDTYGKQSVSLGELQKLRRGKTELPLGGGPDVLNATETKLVDGKLVGISGDSLIFLVEFSPMGAESWSIHQYGSSSRPTSEHFADQASSFVRHELKPSLRTMEEIRAALEREYHPGS